MGALARPHGKLQEEKTRRVLSGCQQPAEEKKEEEGAARLLAAWPAVPGRLGCVLLAAWPVRPDRLDPPRAPRGSRATPSGCADALRERRAAPAVFDDLRLGYTKINVSSSPAYFFTARARITPSDARGLSPHFITVASLFAPAPARVGPGAGRLA